MPTKRGELRTAPPAIELPVTVEFDDVDSYGIAHHSRLIAYLERARVRLLRNVGVDLRRHPVNLVVYRMAVRYARPARLLDELTVGLRVQSVDEYKLVVGQAIRRAGVLIAKAVCEMAFVDAASGRMAPMPENLRAKLTETARHCGRGA